MASSRKRSRKSKLEVREDVDFEDEKLQEVFQSIEQETKIIDSLNPPVCLSIKVEVEEINEDFCIKYPKPSTNVTLTEPKTDGPCIINEQLSFEEALQKYPNQDIYPMLITTDDEILNTSTAIINQSVNMGDRIIDSGLRNIIGTYRKVPIELPKHDILLNNALTEYSKIFSVISKRHLITPLFYQCYICNQSWWQLHPFREHLKTHNSDDYSVFFKNENNEVFLIASVQPVNEIVYIETEGCCDKCGNDTAYHRENRSKYVCKYCLLAFQCCDQATSHITSCVKRIPDLDEVLCNICNDNVNGTKMAEHLLKMHTVRSDLPVPILMKRCHVCKEKYHHFNFHRCPNNNLTGCCSRCSYKYTFPRAAFLHKKNYYYDEICSVCPSLYNKCREIEHMLEHTNNYRMMYRCLLCDNKAFMFDTNTAMWHLKLFHTQKVDARRNKFYQIPLPVECINRNSMIIMSNGTDVRKSKVLQLEKEFINREIIVLLNTNTSNYNYNIDNRNIKINKIKIKQEPVTYESILSSVFVSQNDVSKIKIKDEPIDIEYNINNDINEMDNQINGMEQINGMDQSNEMKINGIDSKINEMNNQINDIDQNIDTEDENNGMKQTNGMHNHINGVDIEIDEMDNQINDIDNKNNAMHFEIMVDQNNEKDQINVIDNHLNDTDIKTEPLEELEIKPEIMDLNESFDFDVEGYTFLSDEEIGDDYTYLSDQELQELSVIRRKTKENRGRKTKTLKEDKDFLYACNKCRLKFPNFYIYYKHMVKYHDLNEFNCPICDFFMENATKLTAHMDRHVKETFVNYMEASIEKSRKMIRCKRCFETISKKYMYVHWDRHLKSPSASNAEEQSIMESPTPKTIPPKLSQRCLSPATLKKTLEQLTALQRFKRCCVCQRIFDRSYDCKRHLIEHLLLDAYVKKFEVKLLQCQLCQKEFNTQSTYKFHMREHGGMPIYQCVLCNKTFSDSSNFAKHKKVHLNDNTAIHVCDICKMKFHTKKYLEKHLESHDDPIHCKPCNKIFYRRGHYRRHVYAKHVKRKYVCKICNDEFDSLREKWDHDWSIHNERKNRADCVVCKKEFRKINEMKQHVKNEHSDTVLC